VDTAIADQPFVEPASAAGAPVDVDFTVDPGGPLEAIPDAAPAPTDGDLARLHNVPVELAVEIGRTTMTIGETLSLAPGSIVSLNRLAGEPVDLLVNGKVIAQGEVVVIDEEFGLRITDIVSTAQRLTDAATPAE
jgi:flagellar motor switch protein FliN